MTVSYAETQRHLIKSVEECIRILAGMKQGVYPTQEQIDEALSDIKTTRAIITKTTNKGDYR